MDPSDFSFDALFSSQAVDELVIPQQSSIMATTQQQQEIENQVRTNRTRNNEPDVSIGFDQDLTNQTIFQSASYNSNAVGWNWVDNTHSVNTSHSQVESQGFVLQSTRNNNMIQEIPEVRRTMEATSSIQLPLDLSEIFVFPIESIESANQPSEPPPLYPVSHQSDNIVLEQLSNLSTFNTTAPQAVHSTAFVNPGENSERSTSQNNSNFPYLMSNNGYSSHSTPQQNSEGAPIMNYNNRNNLTPITGSAFHRFQYELYRSRPSPRTHEQSSEQQNRTTGTVSHSSRLTSSHEGYTQSRIHPYYTTEQQQRDSADILGRRFGHNQNSATFPSSSDSANYYQRNANQQTVDYSTIQSNLTTATNLPTTYELDRPNFIRTVNNSESVSTSDSQSTSVGSRTSQVARESSFFTSSNNSLGGASVFLPFNQPKQEPKRNNRWANGMIKPLNRNTKISTAVQLSAARQFITQAASSAAAAGYSEFSRSLTEILQDLEKLTNSFSPEFLISGQAEIKAFRSPIPRIPTCSVCLDKLISTILFPCRHFICENCAPKIDKCGLCRNIIQSRHQVYF